MSWEYRVIDFGSHSALHEVYYDKCGEPASFAENPATFDSYPDNGEKPEDITTQLARALNSARKPVLQISVFKVQAPG
jgi:hypothetical protein